MKVCITIWRKKFQYLPEIYIIKSIDWIWMLRKKKRIVVITNRKLSGKRRKSCNFLVGRRRVHRRYSSWESILKDDIRGLGMESNISISTQGVQDSLEKHIVKFGDNEKFQPKQAFSSGLWRFFSESSAVNTFSSSTKLLFICQAQ